MFTKAKAIFELKVKGQLIFKRKRQVLFATGEITEKELDRLEKIEELSNTDNSAWPSPTVCIKKIELQNLDLC